MGECLKERIANLVPLFPYVGPFGGSVTYVSYIIYSVLPPKTVNGRRGGPLVMDG